MSSREKRKEIIFGVVYSILTVLTLFATLAQGKRDTAIACILFGFFAAHSWIKLAMHAPRKKRPTKPTAAELAQRAELAAQKADQAVIHQNRKAAYLANPVPLQIRQWNKAYLWEWEYKRRELNRTMYVWSNDKLPPPIEHMSGAYRDCCKIYQKDGIWYLQPITYNVKVRMNPAAARNLCDGMQVNTDEFTVLQYEEQELIPGDCFTILAGSQTGYYRVEQRKNT